jgi:hypothetical protein
MAHLVQRRDWSGTGSEKSKRTVGGGDQSAAEPIVLGSWLGECGGIEIVLLTVTRLPIDDLTLVASHNPTIGRALGNCRHLGTRYN